MADMKISAFTPTTNPVGLEVVGARSGANFKGDLGAMINAIVQNRVRFGAGSPAVTGTTAGDLYTDTTGKDLYLWDGSAWKQVNIDFNITASNTSPAGSGVNQGDLHIDYVLADIYVWDGSVWVKNNASGTGGPVITSGSGTPAGSGVTIGDIYVDTVNGDLYSWDGSIWNLNNAATGVTSTAPNNPATDLRVAVYNGVTGQIIKDVPVKIDTSGNITDVNDLTVGGITNLQDTTITNLTVTGTLNIPDTGYRFWLR